MKHLAIAALAAAALLPVTAAHADAQQQPEQKPTVVLVHGAFADASSWAGVTERLQRDGYTVVAAPVPLRSLEQDSEYVANVMKGITGPVLLVGHSYGGAVITNAATRAKAAGLVYVTAFAPDKGESAGSLDARFDGPATKVTKPGATKDEVLIKPELFRSYFAQDVDKRLAAVMGASQRPVAIASLTGVSGDPAWKHVPSWYAVATKDRMIPPAGQQFMAKRMNAKTVSIPASHAVTVSRPDAVTRLIETAATSIQKDAR